MSRSDGATAAKAVAARRLAEEGRDELSPLATFDACAGVASPTAPSVGWVQISKRTHGGPVMATPIDLLDPPAVMSYGGLVDPSTVGGQVDEAADWCGAVAALLTVRVADERAEDTRDEKPVRHMRHITRRRGAYSRPLPR